MSKPFKQDLFDKAPLVGIMRHFPDIYLDDTVRCFQKSGFTTLEITMNTKTAKMNIQHLIDNWGKQLNIGAGTVCNLADLDEALSAGAQFIVAPIVNEEVIKTCVSMKIPVFPGAFTPTEVYKAWSLGASMVKLFPAERLGVSYVKEILAPLNEIKLMTTGGITVDNFSDYFSAGAKAVGIASNLFPMQLIEDKKWNELENYFAKFINRYNNYINAKEIIKND
jgi:2-dehydro-3-deoxyphosphogluconate aldolase / (4S)-4-hydroxy-2-oxoglutarate aldolase